ncbi:scarecrow-like protein 18 [Nicotiana tabacum]|uniref:DELLA protein RGL1-like n=1 Tax=Nicotiana tabacum TaxID=4097 RepID=A0A1S4BHG3_TOBAC|nr:PREDICTED: DELLA protein RGL1-like [Nicotiana tabacum]
MEPAQEISWFSTGIVLNQEGEEDITSKKELPSNANFVTFDDWYFDVENETKNALYVTPENLIHNKKARASLISSLNILKDFGNGFRKLKGQKITIQTSEIECANDGKLSTDAILRLGGQNFIQSFESSVSSSVDHAFVSSLLSLSEKDSRNVELVECLLSCAEKVEQKQYDRAIKLLNECDKLSSKTGNPVQRLVYYFSRALRERVDKEIGKNSTKSLEIYGMRDLQEALRSINQCTIAVQDMPLCQVIKFAGIQAIVENVRNSKKIHIIDLEIKMGVQWTILIQALVTHQQESQSPFEYLKITALGNTQSRIKLEETGKRLMRFAESLNLLFYFKSVITEDILDLKKEDLDIDPEETIAVYAQHFLTNMIMKQEKLDFLMRFIKGINPRVMVIAEVEANHNSPIFVNRFIEALFYHGAFFDLFEDCMKNNESNRTTMESEFMWQGIRNIVAAEGEERTIRHVTIELWREYFKRFGMEEMKLSNSSLYQAKMVLEKFSTGNSFTLEMNGNFLVIGWKKTPLISLSAWKFRKRSNSHGTYFFTL